jgi:hypothetical protein
MVRVDGLTIEPFGNILACPPLRMAGGHTRRPKWRNRQMGRGILLWLLGIPIPIIILILLFWR